MDQLHVTIAGSYSRHLKSILAYRQAFVDAGARVVRPVTSEIEVVDEGAGIVRLAGDPEDAASIASAQRRAVSRSDVLYVVNPGGYVGPSALVEIGYAYALGVIVVAAEPAYERAAGQLTHHATPADVVAAYPRSLLSFGIVERRLLSALARENLSPWLATGQEWSFRPLDGGFQVIHDDTPFVEFHRVNGWHVHATASPTYAHALLDLLDARGGQHVTAD